jgi:hypothetical protein
MALADVAKKHVKSMDNFTFTVSDLLGAEPPQSTEVIPGILSAGLTLLVAKPKLGKSFLCLLLAMGLANGKVWESEVEPQKTLYLALEDTRARLRKRLKSIGLEDPCKRVQLICNWVKVNELGELRRYLQNNPDTRLVIIDTLARFASWTPGNNYHIDYEEISQYKALADSYGIALVLVHHESKKRGQDRFDRVSGSTGLTAAVDAVITLERSRSGDEGTLFISSRDQEDTEVTLRFNRQTCTWELREPEEGVKLTPERQEIVAVLKAAPGPLRPQDLAKILGKKEANLCNLLKKLINQGIVERVRTGQYQLKSRPDRDHDGPTCKPASISGAEDCTL